MLTVASLIALLQGPPTIPAELDPTFRSDPRLQIVRLWHLAQLPAGDILLIDQGGTSVQHLDQTGRMLPPLARNGAGPGEVKIAFAIGHIGDSLWIADAALRRLTLYSPALKLLRTDPTLSDCGREFRAMLPAGDCLALRTPILPPTAPDPPFLPVLRISKGTVIDTLGELVPATMRIRYADAGAVAPQPFANDPVMALSPNGRYLAWVDQRPIAPTDPAQIRVRTRNLLTNISHTFLVPYRPVRIPEDSIAHLEATFRNEASRLPGFGDSLVRRLFRPTNLPAMAGAILTDAGDLWLGDQPSGPSAPWLWRVFSSDGKHKCTLMLPIHARLAAVGDRSLLGIVTDEDEVQQLVRFRMPPTGC